MTTHRGPVLDRGGPPVAVGDGHHERRLARGRRARASRDGIAYLHAGSTLSLVRVQERETGFFEDLEALLERVVPGEAAVRERLVAFLLGPRSEQVPFTDGAPLPRPVAADPALLARRRAPPEWTLTSSASRGTRSTVRAAMLVLTRSEVEELLDLEALLDALAAAHAELSAGRASLVPRVGSRAEHGGILGAMLGYAPSAGLGCKLVTLFPGNRDRPTHQAAIALFDPETGTPTALMDGTYITAMRTAAAAALATRLLARPDARVLAILGTGVQSRSAQEMFPRARDFAEVRVAGRGEFEDAVRGADVVHATTASQEPVVRLEWLSPGRTSVRSARAWPAAPS